MKIFITGASGFVGDYLLKDMLRVLDHTATIYTLLRSPIEVFDPRVKVLKGSLEEIEKYSEELCDCEYVYHLAADANFNSKGVHEKITYDVTKKMVDLLSKSQKLENFIFTSTIGAMDRAKGDDCALPLMPDNTANPRSEYGKFKLMAEQYIRGSSIPYTIFRPTWVYGKGMRENSHINLFVTLVSKRSLISRIRFPGKVSVIHVEDLSHALIKCIDNQNVISRIYIAETESISIGDIFNEIRKNIRNNLRRVYPSPPLKYIVRRFHHVLPVTVNNLFIDYLCARDDEFKRTFDLLTPRKLSDHIKEVIKDNSSTSGAYIITGANSGIGFSLAKLLAGQGKPLILIDKCVNNLQAFSDHSLIKADLTEKEDIQMLGEQIGTRKIRCLINNAGVGYRGSIDSLSMEQIEKTIFTNILGTLLLTKTLLLRLIKCRSIIVNIASSVAYNPLPNMSIYSASKAFIKNWSDSLSYELRKTNRVVTISPSGTNTGFQSSAGVRSLDPDKTLLNPEYVASKIERAIHKGSDNLLVGTKAKLTIFVTRLFPRRLNIYFWGYMFNKMR